MNTRHDLDKLKLRFGMLFAALTLFVGQTSVAEIAADKFAVTVFEEGFGKQLMSGKYERAIAALSKRKGHHGQEFVSNNQKCVAYMLAKDLETASAYCNKALATSREVPKPTFSQYYDYDKKIAMALTNRGVVLALQGDLMAAKIDFEAAVDLNSDLVEPANNLKLLEQRLKGSAASL